MSTRMQRIRDPLLIACAGLTLFIAVAVSASSLSWIGRTFPGFLVLDNRVVASAGLAHWPATLSGTLYQRELLAVDGQPLDRADALPDRLEGRAPGEPVEYTLRRDGVETTWIEPAREFTRLDFLLLHGTLLFCGIGLAGIALAIRFLRGHDRVANGTFWSLCIIGLYALTAIDLYGPYRFFRLHALLECFLLAGTLHNALVFPQPLKLVERHPWLIRVGYGASAVLALVMQLALYDPELYVWLHRVAVNGWGVGLALFLGRQIYTYAYPPSFEARQRVKVVVLGTVAALTPQVLITFFAATSGGGIPENLMAFSGIFFPLSLGYAVLRQDLFVVDVIVRRTLNYALLTVLVAAGYAGAVASLDALFHDQVGRGVFAVTLGVLTVAVLMPLRDRVQQTVDRIFFRSAYDFRRLVEETSARLASVSNLSVITGELASALREALQPEVLDFHVRRQAGGRLEAVGGATPLGDLELERAERAARAGRPVDGKDEGLLVPFRVEERTVAILRLGRRLSGRYYGGDDRRLLQTLANQGAVAIENALAIERLAELNHDLEAMVEERTSELAKALHSLRTTQSQLIQQEKMASLGQLVAGVAHEINNPVNFIQGNVHFLREYTESLVEALQAVEEAASDGPVDVSGRLGEIRERFEIEHILSDLPKVFEACDEGVQRTTTIVRDLRTFSRQDSAERQSIDLHEAIDSTLSVLRSRLNDIEVRCEYGELPAVECLAGPISQVLMNLITNAADAVNEQGLISIRTETLGDDRVAFEIRDDGCGIPADQLDRVFDPFFTTTEVGKGTGLGLSISYGIVTRHGGRIEVSSTPGEGTTFRVELPQRMAEVETETAGSPHGVRPEGGGGG